MFLTLYFHLPKELAGIYEEVLGTGSSFCSCGLYITRCFVYQVQCDACALALSGRQGCFSSSCSQETEACLTALQSREFLIPVLEKQSQPADKKRTTNTSTCCSRLCHRPKAKYYTWYTIWMRKYIYIYSQSKWAQIGVACGETDDKN